MLPGAVVAQQMGLGFVTAVDPTQGQQNVIVGNFLTLVGVTLIFATDLHHLVIAALNDSYRLFAPGEMLPFGDIAALVTKDRERGLPRRHSIVGAVPGVRLAV
jgi:flagellar biosynthetic protein FliR